jgi:hypothetical protein
MSRPACASPQQKLSKALLGQFQPLGVKARVA